MFNWVWIAEVTPLTYPNWVDVTEDTAIFPEPFEIKARLAVKSEVFTVEIAPDRSDKPTLNVDYNDTAKTDIKIGTVFFTPRSSKEYTKPAQIFYNYNVLNLATFNIGKNGYRTLSLYDSEVTTDPTDSVRIAERDENGNDTVYILATRSYVNQQITGAINTSY